MQLTTLVDQLLMHLGYLGLFIALCLANLGMPVGSEVVMPTAGALAGSGHLPSPGFVPAWVLVGAVGTLGELCGGLALYTIGWFGGLPFVHRYGRYVGFREHHLARVHAFYERHGRSMVFWCRFIPFVRGVSALPPGVSRMQKRYFLTYTALGSAIFCFGLSYLGDVAGHNIGTLTGYLHDFTLLIVAGLAVALVLAILYWRLRARRRLAAASAVGEQHRDRQAGERLV